jgi:hypothetical protein
MFSFLTELSHVQTRGNRGPIELPKAASQLEFTTGPFDELYGAEIPSRSQNVTREASLRSIANYLALEATTSTGTVLRTCRSSISHAGPHPSKNLVLQTLGCVAVPPLSGSQSPHASAQVAQITDRVFKAIDASLLDCGYQRRTLAITPDTSGEALVWRVYKSRRPTMAIIPAQVSQPYLVCDGYGLRAIDLAARLAEDFPDIDQAARRLHARNDLEFPDLRGGKGP